MSKLELQIEVLHKLNFIFQYQIFKITKNESREKRYFKKPKV